MQKILALVLSITLLTSTCNFAQSQPTTSSGGFWSSIVKPTISIAIICCGAATTFIGMKNSWKVFDKIEKKSKSKKFKKLQRENGVIEEILEVPGYGKLSSQRKKDLIENRISKLTTASEQEKATLKQATSSYISIHLPQGRTRDTQKQANAFHDTAIGIYNRNLKPMFKLDAKQRSYNEMAKTGVVLTIAGYIFLKC